MNPLRRPGGIDEIRLDHAPRGAEHLGARGAGAGHHDRGTLEAAGGGAHSRRPRTNYASRLYSNARAALRCTGSRARYASSVCRIPAVLVPRNTPMRRRPQASCGSLAARRREIHPAEAQLGQPIVAAVEPAQGPAAALSRRRSPRRCEYRGHGLEFAYFEAAALGEQRWRASPPCLALCSSSR
jgi:hypothetical protein